METTHALVPVLNGAATAKKTKPFIEANTEVCTLQELSTEHIIPVFVKDNEPLISHQDFIDATLEAFDLAIPGFQTAPADIRVSHAIKGRIPEARHKAAKDLEDREKTLYYERMMFCVEVPALTSMIDGNLLSLTFGGVKAYNMDNLNSKKGNAEKFKLFIGFKNQICTNLCVWTDGYAEELKATDMSSLVKAAKELFRKFNPENQLSLMKRLTEIELSETQFAQMIGRCKMYQFLPQDFKNQIEPMHFGDHHLNLVCKDYYEDRSFSRNTDGSISLWNMYNLFTGANKNSYIDKFLQRSENASHFAMHLAKNVGSGESWFLK